jgi:hypothetical protein
LFHILEWTLECFTRNVPYPCSQFGAFWPLDAVGSATPLD